MKKEKLLIITKWGALLGAGLSLIKLLGYCAEKLEYAFGPVSDLLMVAVIVLCIYMAVKQVRDNLQDGLIKFSRAFLMGCGVVFLGYIILSLYMMLHFNVIDREGVAKINTKSMNHTAEVLKKDTVTQAEMKAYCADMKKIALEESYRLGGDSLHAQCDSGIVVIYKLFERSLNLRIKDDSTILRRDTFDICADRAMREASAFVQMNKPEVSGLSHAAIETARDSMAVTPLWQKKLDSMKKQIPQYHTTFAAATITTMAILLYGLMLNIFVALFLYRKENTVCSRNGNDPMSADEDDGEETKNEEDETTDKNQQ